MVCLVSVLPFFRTFFSNSSVLSRSSSGSWIESSPGAWDTIRIVMLREYNCFRYALSHCRPAAGAQRERAKNANHDSPAWASCYSYLPKRLQV